MLVPLFLFVLVPLFAKSDGLITYKLPITDEIRQALGYAEGSYLNFTERTSSFGYSSEQHNVTTEDGYILTFFRTSSPNCTQLKTYPMFLLHGILSNSDSFLDAGRNASLVYLLADQCYDVWVANLRGNDYARAHTTLNPDKDAAFWRYSADDVGYYDAPATINYILNITGAEKLNLLSFSLGGQVIVVMCADRPEYNEKINILVALAPPTRNINIRSFLFTLLFRFFNSFGWILQSIGIEEVIFKNSLIQVLLEYVSAYSSFVSPLILGVIDSYNPGSISGVTALSVFSHTFVGGSVQQLAKAGQDSLNEEFRHYDFGALKNLAKYKSITAPAYNLTNVVAPNVLVTGLSDTFVASVDVQWLGQQLPNNLAVIEVSDPLWNHSDNVFSSKIPTLLFPQIKEYLDLYNP